MSYETLRLVHIVCAHLSIAGFVLRGAWMLRDSPLLATRWARTLPHINDTVLLAAAIALAVWSQQAPWAQAWLAAKIASARFYAEHVLPQASAWAETGAAGAAGLAACLPDTD